MFVAIQSLVLIAVRLAVGGLDKALLWWVGGHEGSDVSRAVWSSVAIVTATSLFSGALLALFGRAILAYWEGTSPEQFASWAIMLLGLPLMALTDVILHATMGQRRMGPQVAIRDTLVPVSWLLGALGLHALGWRETGLAWAFALSNGLGLLAALIVLRRSGIDLSSGALRPPRELVRYALPCWLNEIANSTLLRIDVLVLAAMLDPFTVGIWGLITQFVNAMRSIRRAFDPILIAVTARISQHHDNKRLAESLSYATQLVFLSQHPVFVFFLLFAGALLPLYGPGFERGQTALIVLCGFWLVNGAVSLSGTVLAGYGQARWALFMTLLGIALEVPLLGWLVPRYGLLGAALAAGLMNTFLQVLQLGQLKRVTGSYPYTARAFRPLGPALWSGIAAAFGWLLANYLAGAEVTGVVGHGLAAPLLAFVCFAAVYAAAVGRQWKMGLLRAPGH